MGLIRAALMAILAAQGMWVMVLGLGRPLVAWDSWVNWAMKARILFAEQGLTPRLYGDATRLITHPSYPLLAPELQAWIYAWLGAADDRFAALPGILFYLATLVGVKAALERAGVPPAQGLLAVTVLGSLPGFSGWTALAYPDAIVAGLAALAAANGLAWAQGRRPGSLGLAAVAIGLLPWAKQEGLVLAGVLTAALAVISGWRGGASGQRAAILAVAWPLAAVVLFAAPWLILMAVEQVPQAHYARVNLTVYLERASRLLFVARHGVRVLLEGRTAYAWLVAAFVAGLATVRGGWRWAQDGPAAVLGLVVPVVYLGLVAQPFVFSDYAPYEQHVITSLERLLLHVAPLPVVWLAAGRRIDSA
jgi:hypothetical protein